MALFEKIKRRINCVRAERRALPEAKSRLLSSTDLSSDEKAVLGNISLRLHHADTMYAGDASHYLKVGLSASRCIREALRHTAKESAIESILDFPAGYGRVLRFIRAMFPEADITAAEIESDSLAFCRRTFSVDTFLSKTDINTLSLPKQFNLIWCGSLFTHISEPIAVDLLQFFYDHLSDQGVCIFTTHGQYPIEQLRNGKNTYGLTDDASQQVVREVEKQGYGYADYSHTPGYGVSAVSCSRMLALADQVGQWYNVLFSERGWDNHQDVYAFAKQSQANIQQSGSRKS